MEGRSHKEIAEVLDITPSQAKALIHRAKGSFRRNWLLAITEKGGLAGIALLPLIWMLRVADGARKIVDKVGGHATQVSQAATPELVTTAASSPASVSAAASMTERVVAAGMTILVAGGVTMGAATIVKSRGDREQGNRVAPVVASPAAPQTEASEVLAPVVAPSPEEQPRVKPSQEEPVEEEPASVVDPPVDDPAASPSPDASPSADPSPTDEPSPSPSPEGPPPAPAWTYALTASTESVDSCECEETRLASSHVSRDQEGNVAFSAVVTGGALDAVGDPTWPYYVLQEATITPEGGHLQLRFGLTSAAGRFLYGGEAALVESVELEDGSRIFTFEGTYDLLNPQLAAAGLPQTGIFTATVGIWTNGKLYTGSLVLTDQGI
jgi:hypothetical protein